MFFLPIIAVIVLVIADQLTKLLTLNQLKPIGTVEVIKDFFYLTYVENTGAAFGFMSGARWIFIIVTIAVLIAGGVYYVKMSKTNYTTIIRFSLVLICAGAIGNFIDRLFRGFVIDMLHFVFWGYDFAVFNFADILVVCGTILLAGSIIFSSVEDEKKEAA